MCTVPLFNRICRESYNQPEQVYEILKRRGMDLVTITDHDSIDAAEKLRHHADFFLSEEVSAVCPSGTQLHIGVYDIHERHHLQMARRRNDMTALLAYLKEQRIFFTVNHVYSSLTGRRTEEDFALFARDFPGLEALNGQMPAISNQRASELAMALGKAPCGGSDAHTLESLGRTYTEIGGARTKQQFLAGLRSGRGSLHGDSGSYCKLTRAVWSLGLDMLRERPATRALAPLLFAVPAVTLANYIRELVFVAYWARRTGAWAGTASRAIAWAQHRRYTEAQP